MDASRPSSIDLRRSPLTPTMDREYEFFVTTDQPQQPEGSDRGRIRRVVMRNFFESKGNEDANTSSKQNSASTVQAKTQLKTRFRLPKSGDDKAGGKSKSRGKNAENRKDEANKKDDRPKPNRRLSGQPTSSQQVASNRDLNKPIPPEPGPTQEPARPGRKILLKIIPSAHRFDPFDVLPVPGSQGLDLLFQLCKSAPGGNSITINTKRTWWNLITHDAGLLHAHLATWALYGMLAHGIEYCRMPKLRHKNEAIKAVNVKLGSLAGKSRICDQLVGTVLTLASFENLNGEYDAAQLHIAALKRMVDARGGLFAFGHNDGLMRGMIWVDFHTSTAFHTSPSWPRIRLEPDTPPLPDALLEAAALTSPTSLLQLSLAAIDCFNIFYRLHRAALALSSQWVGSVHSTTTSNLMYELMYITLEVPDHSRLFLDFDRDKQKDAPTITPMQEHPPDLEEEQPEDDMQEREEKANAASVIEALLTAVQIFVYSALRGLPPKAKLFSILLERLRRALDRQALPTSLFDVWNAEKNGKTLLWVLVVGYSVADAWYGRAWWAGKIAETLKDISPMFPLGLAPRQAVAEEDFKRLLKGVVWTDGWFEEQVKKAWRDADEAGRQEVVLGGREEIGTGVGQLWNLQEDLGIERMWRLRDGTGDLL